MSKQYDEGRHGSSEQVLDYLWYLIKHSVPHILDVGCGTGISSRQLAEKGALVTASDRDPGMINQALERPLCGITYVTAPTEGLPFGSDQFDAVTAFSAFHWFQNQDAISEIKRVLRPKGVFFVANKNDIGDFKVGYRAVLKQFIGGNISNIKIDYDPAKLLIEGNFKEVKERIFEVNEFFTLTQGIAYLQSVSIWNLVPSGSKKAAIKAIENYCQERLVDGFIERKLQVLTVIGKK